MARFENPFRSSPYPTDPTWGALGQNLVTALFGDPTAAREKQAEEAKIDALLAGANADRERGGYYHAQAMGETQKYEGREGVGGIIANLIRASSAPMALSPAGGADGDWTARLLPDLEAASRQELGLPPGPIIATPPVPMPTATNDVDAFREGLPALLGALIRGDVDQPDEVVRAVSAFAGGDELARRGLVGAGDTPGEWFAITPERRDAIARQGYDAEYRKAVDVENIQSGDRRYDTDVDASTARRGQDVSATTARRGQDVSATTARRGQDITRETAIYKHDTPSGTLTYKAGARIGNGIGKTVVGAALPGAMVTDNERTRAEARRIYAQQHPGKTPPANSWHYTGEGWDVRPIKGMTFDQARQRVSQAAAARGARVVEAKNEGTHWHFGITGGRAAPRIVPVKQMGDFDAEIRAQLGGNTTPRAMAALRTRAVSIYQYGGNPAQAVSQALREARYLIERKEAPAGPKPAVKGRPAPARAAPRVIRYDAQGRRVS